MNAGPELDTMIAEKVMGWKLKKMSTSDYWVGEHDGLEGDWSLVQMWKPSTDIRDAWEVVKKFKESRFSVRKGFINELQQLVTPDEIKASGNLLHESELIYYLTPLAICITALMAIGLEVPND